MNKIKSISILFPLYNDKSTVEVMIIKSLRVLKKLNKKCELIIVDDGCPQKSGQLAARLTKKISNVKIFFHKKNLGYGTAIRTGLKKCKNDWIFITDGDNEFDVNDLLKLVKAIKRNDLVISYRHKKIYNTKRIIISWTYNVILRFLFRTKFRDVSSASRLVSKKIIKKIKLKSTSPFLGAEIAIKSLNAGYKVGQVGIYQFPQTFRNESVSIKNIILTIKDMILLYCRNFRERKLSKN
jgi:glycosyltransferase involved in cell wall biosynthesis